MQIGKRGAGMTGTAVKKAKRVTRNDVAKRANVSPAVVSYVINNSKFVSPEKVAAVRRAIDELQYRPNMQARGLKTNRSMQIAFVCDNLMNYWLEDAEQRLFENGYYVSHCYSREGGGFIQMLIARRFDGVFMMSNRYSTAQLNELADAGIPLVLFRTRNYGVLRPQIATVAPDYRDGVVKCVNYLVMKGHTRIALLPPVRYRTAGLQDDGFRVAAYVDTLRENGIQASEELVCRDTSSMQSIVQSAADMLLRGKANRPTAFIAGNDYIAIQLMKEIRQLGLRIPEDVAVIGADNTYVADAVCPTLTTVSFSKDEFCRAMADTMLALIRGGQPKDQYIKVSVVKRESA